jgi:hypothetical protein
VTAAELLTILREDYLDDASAAEAGYAEDARWSDAFLLRRLAEAEREACRRQDLRHLFDDTTQCICQIATTAGTASYNLDSRILRLQQVRLDDGDALVHVSQAQLEAARYDWRGADNGTPQRFFVTGRRLTLECPPSASGTLYLSVWRDPLYPIETTTDEFEWPGDQEKLCHWAAYRAFMRPEEDSQRLDLAKFHRELFDVEFGPPLASKVRQELLELPDTLAMVPLQTTSRRNRGFDYCDY